MRTLDLPPSARMPRAYTTAALLSRMTPTPALSMPTKPVQPILALAAEMAGAEFNDLAQLAETRRRSPFAVERYPAASGFIRLIGYDHNGDFACETVMLARRFTERTIPKMRRWLMDDASEKPTLSLIG